MLVIRHTYILLSKTREAIPSRIHQVHRWNRTALHPNWTTRSTKKRQLRTGTTMTRAWIITWLSRGRSCTAKTTNSILELGHLKIMVFNHSSTRSSNKAGEPIKFSLNRLRERVMMSVFPPLRKTLHRSQLTWSHCMTRELPRRELARSPLSDHTSTTAEQVNLNKSE